jgi:4-amino-4-deoxy-L-arabinose transferase-like glycosyltransferase
MNTKTFLILVALVFLPSSFIRLHPTTSESFAYDAVVSQIGAAVGIVPNALDTSDAFALRRYHPPLLSYVIQLDNRIFGDGPFGARIFSIFLGALTCLAVAIGIAAIARPTNGWLLWAILGGWLLCLLPVHLYVSRTSNWDAVYGFFATSCLLFLGLYAAENSPVRLWAAAIFGTLAFLTCELGIALLPAAVFAMVADATRLPRQRLLKRWAGAFAVVLIVLALFWPGGFIKLDLLRMMLYRWRDSAVEPRNAPWYVFYTELFRQATAFTLFMIVGIVATLLPAIMNRGARLRDRTTLAVLPLWIYVATAFVLSLKERLVYVHHIVDMFPPLVTAVCAGLAARTATLSENQRRWVLALGAGAVAFSILAALNPDPEVVGPQEHPGFLGVSDELRDHPGARIYCHDTLVLGFYLPHATIEGGKSRFWTADDAAAAKQGNYDFVVFDRAKLNADYPTAERIIDSLAPVYHVTSMITHRRTKEPVAWILSHSQ